MSKGSSYVKYLGIIAVVALLIFIAYIAIKGVMFILWPNTVLFISVALVAATIGFIIYGNNKGFENTFPND
jgi:hypothetical protein